MDDDYLSACIIAESQRIPSIRRWIHQSSESNLFMAYGAAGISRINVSSRSYVVYAPHACVYACVYI